MRVPRESLNDFTGKAAPPKKAEPPVPVSLCLSGRIRVLEPLAGSEGIAKNNAIIGRRFHARAPHGLSWFHRSLAMGGGFAMIAIILVTGIHVAIFGPPVGEIGKRDVAADGQTDSRLTPSEKPFTSDLSPDVFSPTALSGLNYMRPAARRRPARPRVIRAVYRPRRTTPPSQLVWSGFTPTTLVIYVEDGEVKTRIEPQLAAGYRKS